ncbi:MAG: DUF861 domain-containing protein [Candidatus Omnitrophica bacterium]|nr:DUF861 domain-containing protein [Candidatus Omnitrophota bacterium]MBD3269050.1 DUF861 domain-containing protein [Candidatus Omnitrophota bacterium]
MEVKITRPKNEEIEKSGIKEWPIWEKEESKFDWYYDEKETCYLLEGEVKIEIPDGEDIRISEGDMVVFPKGLRCVWDIKKKVRKHYNFG